MEVVFMSDTETRKCPKCEKDAAFIGYVDKKSGQTIGIEFTGDKCRVPGGLLSGSLRKYRCPDGH